MNGARETAVEAESIYAPLLSALTKSYLSIRQKVRGEERNRERENW